jgi:hypothetical protein
MKILVTGSRYWTNSTTIRNVLETVSGWSSEDFSGITVIHGACKGADLIAEQEAIDLGMNTKSYSANWDEYGKAAGMIRNKEMLDKEHPDLVLAFHEDLFNKSKGTLHMVKYALEKGVPVEIYPL